MRGETQQSKSERQAAKQQNQPTVPCSPSRNWVGGAERRFGIFRFRNISKKSNSVTYETRLKMLNANYRYRKTIYKRKIEMNTWKGTFEEDYSPVDRRHKEWHRYIDSSKIQQPTQTSIMKS